MLASKEVSHASLIIATSLAAAIALCLVQPISALSHSKISAATSSGGGPVGGVFPIAVSGLQEQYPAAAYNPHRHQYLVVWHNDRPGNDDIQAQTLSKDGKTIGTPVFVAAGPGIERNFPDVAYNSVDQEYLVVWEAYVHSTGKTVIRAHRLNGAGERIGDVFDIFTQDKCGAPAVAYAGSSNKYLVVWSWFLPPHNHIVAQTLSINPFELGAPEVVYNDTTGHGAWQPDVAYCGARNEHLVVWQQEKTPGDRDIHARRVTGDGQPLAPPVIYVSTVTDDEAEPSVGALALAPHQGHYLVAWERNDGTSMGVQTKKVHVAADGGVTLIWCAGVGDLIGDERYPAVVGNQQVEHFLVTWQQHVEYDIGGGLFLFHDLTAGRAVRVDGSPLGGDLSIIGGVQSPHSAVAAGPGGDFLVAFDDLVPTFTYNISGRVWGNRVYLPLVLRRY